MARGIRNESHRLRSRLIVKRVLARAVRKGWDVDKTAAVIVVSLAPARVRAGVVGPCFYCGDDLAGTVDHLHALSIGGADDRTNVVSCCFACNTLKHALTVGRFLQLYPFGSDLQRTRRFTKARRTPEYERLTEIQGRRLRQVMASWQPQPDEPWGLPRLDDTIH